MSRRPLPVQTEHERHKRAHQRDLIRARNHVIDLCTAGSHCVAQHEHGEQQHGHAHCLQRLLVVHVFVEVLVDVFNERDAGREQRCRCRGLDRREQRSKKDDLSDHRHLRQNQSRQNFLGVAFQQFSRLLRQDHQCRDHQKHRHECKQQIANPANHWPLRRRFDVLRRHHALKHVLLRNRAQHDGDGGSKEKQHVLKRWLREETKHVLTLRKRNHFVRTTRHVSREHSDDGEPDDEHNHLDKVGHGHAPHAAEQRVDQDGNDANDHAPFKRDASRRKYVEHEA